jgi:hypothetical protein
MKNTQRGAVAAIALMIVVGLMFVMGGSYVYSKYKKDSADRDLIFSINSSLRAAEPTERALQISADLAWAKTRLQMETTKLNALKTEAALAGGLDQTLRDTYLKVNNAIANKTNFQLQTNTALQTQLTATRAEISAILNNWQSLVTTQNTSALQAAIKKDLPTVQNYLNTLSNTVNSLTPANSGLTQTQITTYQNAVTAATEEVNNAVVTLTTAETTNTTTQTSTNTTTSSGSNTSGSSNTGGSNTGGSTNTQQQIEEQQEIVDQIEEEIQDLEEEQTQVQNEINNGTGDTTGGTTTGTDTTTQTNTSTSGSGSTGEDYVPPPRTTSGGPQLIQGVNPQ